MASGSQDTDLTMAQMEDALNGVAPIQSGSFSMNTEESIDVKEEEIGDDSEELLGTYTAKTTKELRIVMIGKTGAGKSATGNSLLRVKLFNSNNYGESVTVECKLGTRPFDNGKTMKVIDTPGIFDTRKSNVDTAKEVVRCINLSSPGPHIFLVVLKIGRFTPEENDTIQQLKDLFGEDVMNHAIIVFTGKESLDFDGLTINQQIENSPKDLRSLVDQCKGRIAAINNRDTPTAVAKDVEAILDLMLTVVKENDGGYYTGEMFEAAEMAYKEKLRKIEEEKHKIEREQEQREQEIKQKQQELEAKDLENKEELKRIKTINDENEEELERKKQENEREAERMMEEVKKQKLSNEKMQEEFKKIEEQQNERENKLKEDAQKKRDESDLRAQQIMEDMKADKNNLQKELLKITEKMYEAQQEMEKKNTELQQMNAESVMTLQKEIANMMESHEQDKLDAEERMQTIITDMNAEKNHEMMELQKTHIKSLENMSKMFAGRKNEMLDLMRSKDDMARRYATSQEDSIQRLNNKVKHLENKDSCNIM